MLETVREDLRETLCHNALSIELIEAEAELIREGIGLVTGAHRISEPRLPLFESGQPALAESADEALRGFGER